jgi:hypothetical protein
MAQKYRQTHIDNILNQLKKDRQDRLILCKKHDKKSSTMNNIQYATMGTTMILSASSVGVLSAAIITPVAIGLGVLVTVCGVVSIIVKVVRKKNTIKLKRHYAILSLTDKTISKISQYISTFLDDDNITDDELQNITDAFNSYREDLTLLRNNSMKEEEEVHLKD